MPGSVDHMNGLSSGQSELLDECDRYRIGVAYELSE